MPSVAWPASMSPGLDKAGVRLVGDGLPSLRSTTKVGQGNPPRIRRSDKDNLLRFTARTSAAAEQRKGRRSSGLRPRSLHIATARFAVRRVMASGQAAPGTWAKRLATRAAGHAGCLRRPLLSTRGRAPRQTRRFRGADQCRRSSSNRTLASLAEPGQSRHPENPLTLAQGPQGIFPMWLMQGDRRRNACAALPPQLTPPGISPHSGVRALAAS